MEMIAFTICSTNYFAQAKVLALSWLNHHPKSSFFVVLVDSVNSNVDYFIDERVTLIPVEEIPIPNFDVLVQQYRITELNTAVKPDAFLYIFKKTGCEKLIYIDPDIKVYSHFSEVDTLLDTHDIVVTPHFTTPIDD